MTAPSLTPDEALDLADQWCAGLTMDADSKGWGAILLVLAEEVRRLRADAARLDTLEREAHEPGGIRLHADAFVESRAPCQRGLGLQQRTLREAVDQLMEASNAG